MALAGRVDGTEGSTVLDDVRNGAVTTDLTLKMQRMPWGDRNVLNVVSCTWWRGVRARAAAVTTPTYYASRIEAGHGELVPLALC